MDDLNASAMPVNMDELKDMMDNDMELINDCFNDYLSDWPEIFTSIKAALTAADFGTMNKSAHKLKGMLQYLCAGRAYQAAAAVESGAGNTPIDDLSGMILTLEKECLAVVQYIRQQSA